MLLLLLIMMIMMIIPFVLYATKRSLSYRVDQKAILFPTLHTISRSLVCLCLSRAEIHSEIITFFFFFTVFWTFLFVHIPWLIHTYLMLRSIENKYSCHKFVRGNFIFSVSVLFLFLFLPYLYIVACKKTEPINS